MPTVKVLGALAVRDMSTARVFYDRLFGHPPDHTPMAEAAEWDLTSNGSVQLVLMPDKAGRGILTIGVDDIDAQLEHVRASNIDVASDTLHSDAFRTITVHDPDGNAITFAQDVRATKR